MHEVNVWEEDVVIPTYEVGAPDKNPMFLEKRVYQGSSGRVYPYPTTETISPVKTDKTWHAVFLENEYIKVMVLPELGGRIQRAYDKTNDYDFVYYNHVIKPALVGLAGPWISGGIEFNWPQHHRPTTYMPVDHLIRENEDGSKSLLVNDLDQIYGSKGIIEFTLYPDKAYIEITGRLYNRTPLPQTFLWWANPAVAVNDYTQSVFPPDVHNVMDHGKRDVSRFPIATGVYYKHDYSEGVDISRYKNIPVPTSYMAEKSEYDFVGGYDYSKQAGMLHVADHHISPGKKQWTWGCGDFGKAWDRNLTDEDGPYIELMCGVYTDNQPDFSWLKPFEEKVFKQYFMPYKQLGYVKNASKDAMVNMETSEDGIRLCVYTSSIRSCRVLLCCRGRQLYSWEGEISPVKVFDETVSCPEQYSDSDLELSVYDAVSGKLLVSYRPLKREIERMAEPARSAEDPENIRTNEELYLTGLHIEQYRHASYLPDPYYLEGLKRDPGDIRINNAYGCLLMRRGLFEKAENYFRTAICRLTWKNPNPYDSEAYYNLGLCLFYQEKYDDAFDAFYKAVWSSEQQEMSYYYMSLIATRRGDLEDGLEYLEKGLVKNWHNVRARALKSALLRLLGRRKEAVSWADESLKIDPFDYQSAFEKIFSGYEGEGCVRCAVRESREETEKLRYLMRDFHENFLAVSRDYADAGLYREALAVLDCCSQDKPMLHYYRGFFLQKLGKEEEALKEFESAELSDSAYCFPNKLEDIAALKAAIKLNKKGAKAPYYLGCLYYDKLRSDDAAALWEDSLSRDESFPTVFRNLAIAYYNKRGDEKKARECMERAFELNKKDARVFLELDQLLKKMRVSVSERLALYEKYAVSDEVKAGAADEEAASKPLVALRDDLMIEYLTLLNSAGRCREAYDIIMGHHFRPWEGAEGKVSGQYKLALLGLAREKMASSNWKEASGCLEKALDLPLNLGEGRLEGTKDNNIWYLLGQVKEELKEKDSADCFRKATLGTDEPAGMLYYYDQPADMILYKGLAYEKLGEHRAACACFNKLIDYGESHFHDHVRPDYFAVSLPDFLIFEDDLTKRNEAHCCYLMGLGNLGLGNKEKAAFWFDETIKRDPSHQNAIIYRKMAKEA